MTPDFNQPKAAFYTLGCKLNFVETSTIGKILGERGYRRAQREEEPDLIVLNTCSVTEMADKKGRSLIRRLSRQWPRATMVVTGCYAQLKPEEVASLPGVDIVLGSNEKLRISEFLDQFEASRSPITQTTGSFEITEFRPSCERGDRTRFMLKIQDGCDYFCTYCTIPFARGRSRSGRTEELVGQARQAAAQGGKEIVLTGVNVGEYGRDNGQDFLSLLKALDSVEGIERYRISSIEPNLLTEEIISWIACESKKFMPHFHIPLQSGSDKVLKLMNRRYDTSLFRKRIEFIRSMIPNAFIGVDVIAGARGETEQEWIKSLDFIESLQVTRLHVFPYSERPGTKALNLGDAVENRERHRRVGVLSRISDKKLRQYMKAHSGLEAKVLWEHLVEDAGEGESLMSGLTEEYLRVVAPAKPELLNTVTKVRILDINPDFEETLNAQHL